MANVKFIMFFLFLFIFMTASFSQGIKDYEFGGYFYPEDKDKLNKMIEEFLYKADVPHTDKDILGVISPHAGYIYSGIVAAYGYKAVSGKDFDTVILLAASHRYHFRGVSVYAEGFFNTPFGKIEIDNDLASDLGALSFVKFKPEFFYGEHSLEVQLPFLQKVLTNFKIIPIVFGKIGYEQIQELAKEIAYLSEKKKVLLVASTDLSHYHFYSRATDMDSETVKHIEDIDPLWFVESLDRGEQRACGILPVITFISYIKEREGKVTILKYANSGDTAGDKSKVVGYVSAIGYAGNRNSEKGETMGLTKEEKITLLNIARQTLETYLKNKKIPEFKADSDTLKEKRAVFVTLKKENRLRGCIGRIVADMPLYRAVSKVVIDSALNDPRFSPLKHDELGDIEIEISVMTPFEEVKDIREIEVGKHGLMIKKGFYSGLLLPQVPTEYGWDKKTYLEHLCSKAGLHGNAYKEKDTVIYKFSAEVFSEREVKE